MTKQNIMRRGDNPSLESVIPTPSHKSVFMSYWSTPEALAAHVATMGNGERNWQRSAFNGDNVFRGTKDMHEALTMCRDGWPVGAARAERLRDRINAEHPTGPRVVRWDVAGAIASVPRALAGNPLNMRRVDTAKLRRKPIVTLLSDMTANGSVSANAITNRAAVVAAVVDAVEAAGFACEVISFECSSEGKTIAQIVATTVKESHAPADIGRMAYALGHVSFFRRIAWAAFTHDDFTKPLGSCLGSATPIDVKAANERGAYVLPSAGQNQSAFATEESAATTGLAFLLASLRQQDCPAFPRDSEAA
jgi:hypothetical protein